MISGFFLEKNVDLFDFNLRENNSYENSVFIGPISFLSISKLMLLISLFERF